MDPASPMHRVERTFWAVWTYIAEAVNRFLRPEPIQAESEEQSPLQAQRDDSQNVDSSHPEADADGQAGNEEQPLDSSLTTNSLQPAVAQQLSNADDHVAPAEVNEELQSQLSKRTEDKVSEESEGIREVPIGQTADADLTVCEVAGERSDEESNANGHPEATEDEKYETCETRSESKGETGRMGTGEEIMSAMTPDAEQNGSKTPKKIEEKEEVLHLDEKCLRKEDADTTELSSGERHATEEVAQVTDTVENTETVSNLEKTIQQPMTPREQDIVNETLQVTEEKTEILQRDEKDLEREDANRTVGLTADLAKESDKHTEEIKLRSHVTDLETEGSETVSELGLTDKNSIDEARDEVEVKQRSERECVEQEYTLTDSSGMEKTEKNNSILPDPDMDQVQGNDIQTEREKQKDILTDFVKDNEGVNEKGEAEIFQPLETEDEAEDLEIQTVAIEAPCDGDKMIEKTAPQDTSGEERRLQKDDVQTDVQWSATVIPEGLIDKNSIEEARDEVEIQHRSEGEGAEQEKILTGNSGMEEAEKNNSIFGRAFINQTPDMDQEREKQEDILTDFVKGNEGVHEKVEAEILQAKETEDEAEDLEIQIVATETPCDGDRMFEKAAHEDTSGEERRLEKDDVQTEIQWSATVIHKGETEQEISGGFRTFPPGTYGAQEFNSSTQEETHEGIPEYNNEPAPEENTIQWFLEAGAYKETHVSQLPEEGEGQEQESNENSRSGGDFSVVREQENQDSATEEPTGTPHQEDFEKLIFKPVDESALSPEEGVAALSRDSKNMGTEPPVEELECDVTTTEQRHGNEDMLLSFEKEERVSEVRNAAAPVVDSPLSFTEETFIITEAEENRLPGTGFAQRAVATETSRLEEDATEREAMKQLEDPDPTLSQDVSVEIASGVTDLDTSCDIMKPLDGEILDTPIHTTQKIEICSFESLSLITPNELQEAVSQLSDGSESRQTNVGSADDLETTARKSKELATTTLEEMSKCQHENDAEGCQSVIDEEILDWWIDEALSKNTSVAQQHVDKTVETVKEENYVMPSVQTEAEKEEFAESISEEPGVTLETENSISNMSGLMDQSVNEQDHEEPVTVLFQEPNDTVSVKLSTQHIINETQDVETEQSEETSENLIAEMQFCKEPPGVFLTENQIEDSAAEDGNILSKVSTEIKGDIFKNMTPEKSETHGESEMSSNAALLEYHYQSERDVQHGEISLLKLTGDTTGSFQDSSDMLAPELYMGVTNSESQEAAGTNRCVVKTEEKRVGAAASDRDFSGECLKQEQDECQHKEEEPAESEDGSLTESDAGLSAPAANGDNPQNEFMQIHREEKSPTESEDDESTEYETPVSSLEKTNASTWLPDTVDSSPEPNRFDYLEEPASHPDLQIEVNTFALDFTAQRSRILVKNPSVRKPKDPRSLLQMPSLDPTPASCSPVKIPVGVPLGGAGVGIKLPGLGAGFPVLKKTNVVKEEKSSEEPETNTEEESNVPKPDEAQQTPKRPRWMPPTQPGFSNPLMSELKTKLRKTPKE